MKTLPNLLVFSSSVSRRGLIKRAVGWGIVAFVPFRFWFATREPVVTFAPVVLPNPNAFDVFVRACGQLVQTEKIDKAITPSVPTPDFVPVPLAEKLGLLQANTAALREFQQGLALPYCEPPLQSDDDAAWKHYRKFRAMAKLLIVEGDVHFAQGERERGVQSCLDAVLLGQIIARGGVLISRLVALACQAIGRRPLWKHLNDLDAASAKAGARRMETILAAYVPMGETWAAEKRFIQASYLKSFGDINEMAKGFLSDNQSGETESSPPSWLAKLCVYGMYAIWSKQRLLDNMSGHMDALIRESQKPFAQAREPKPPFDPVVVRVAPVFSQADLKNTVSGKVQNALLCVALALQAYRADHDGTYPASLADLVTGGYLSQIPADPFSPDGTTILRYRRESPTKMVLWSVGPDGKDDNGTAILDATKTGNARYFVTENSRGDIVAGTNIF